MTSRFFRLFAAGVLTVLLISCTSGKTSSPGNEIRMEKPSYARLFETGHAYGGIIANVYQPSDTLTPFRRYFLYEKGAEIPAGLPDGIIPVKVPLEKAGCAHVTQIGFLSALGVADRIKSVGAKAYLEKNSVLENREDLGEFFNGWQFDIEKLLSLNPDGVFFSPGGNEDLSSVENKVPSPMLLDMSPWETHPLARTEWVKFAAEFFCLRDRADSLFNAIEKRYIDVKSKASSSGSSPSVLSSLPYHGVWYMPDGGSYKSVMYRDAGLRFPWADSKGTGSLALDFETVMSKGSDAQVWFFETGLGKTPTLSDLKAQNKLYAHFKAFALGNIFVCNTGDMPYFERGIMEPDRILSDFAFLSRGDSSYTPFYYRKITSSDEK